MTNKDAKEQRDAARKELKRIAVQAEGTMCDVVDEAVEHLLDHYDPEKHPFFKQDFVLVISSSFFGHDRGKGNPVATGEFISRGNLHFMSHCMAAHMAQNKAFAVVMFHAMEVYHRQAVEDQIKDCE
jgi:hypothetical protein